MEYRYTDQDETPIAITLTVRDINRLRRALQVVLADESAADSSQRYAAEDVDRFLRKALDKVADAFENEARSMRERLERMGEL